MKSFRSRLHYIFWTPMDSQGKPLHPLVEGALLDVFWLFFAGLATDYHALLMITLAAVLAHWLGVLLILFVRSGVALKSDIIFAKFGALLLLPFSSLFAGIWLRLAWEMRWWWLAGLR